MSFRITGFVKNTYLGIILVSILAVISFVVAATDYMRSMHLSPLIIGICFGVLCSGLFLKNKHSLEHGVNFSAKRLLRIGIVLFGFNVELSGIVHLGFKGALIAVLIVGVIFIIGNFIGAKLLKLDKQTTMLISIGSAVCGAAAILALESILKSESYKSVIAVANVVIFGLLAMFIFPVVLNTGIVPLDDVQKGLFLGASLHEVANVVGAAGSITAPDDNTAKVVMENALILKMIRVILLVPLLLLITFFVDKNEKGGKIHIPWFAIFFLVAIVINSLIPIPKQLLDTIRFISRAFLVCAMIALGLQIDLKKIKQMGGKIFILSIVLLVFLIVLSYFAVKLLA